MVETWAGTVLVAWLCGALLFHRATAMVRFSEAVNVLSEYVFWQRMDDETKKSPGVVKHGRKRHMPRNKCYLFIFAFVVSVLSGLILYDEEWWFNLKLLLGLLLFIGMFALLDAKLLKKKYSLRHAFRAMRSMAGKMAVFAIFMLVTSLTAAIVLWVLI